MTVGFVDATFDVDVVTVSPGMTAGATRTVGAGDGSAVVVDGFLMMQLFFMVS